MAYPMRSCDDEVVIRRGLPWLVTMPCFVAGSIAGHLFGSHLLEGRSHEVAERIAEASTQGSPLVGLVGLAGALLVTGSVLLVRALAGRQPRSMPPLLAFLLPIAAWPAQEIVERMVGPEGIEAHAVADPPLLAGIALQIPFALLALLLAKLLFKAAVRIVSRLAARRTEPRRRVAAATPKPGAQGPVARPRVAALGRAQRAPPLPVAASIV